VGGVVKIVDFYRVKGMMRSTKVVSMDGMIVFGFSRPGQEVRREGEGERERMLKIRNQRLQERGTGGRGSREGCDEKVRKCRKRIK
jgi:hypothetical protein